MAKEDIRKTASEQPVARMVADAVAAVTAYRTKGAENEGVPAILQESMDLFLRSLRQVLGEYDGRILAQFDALVAAAVEASGEAAPQKRALAWRWEALTLPPATFRTDSKWRCAWWNRLPPRTRSSSRARLPRTSIW